MFDVAPTELLLVVVVALVVIGPKDLPKAMRFVGKWVGKARGMARHFRSGLDTMMREAELEELEKQWREQNDAIMREFPRIDDVAAGTPPILAATDSGEAPPENPDHAAAATKPETHEVPPRDGPLP
ncbi:MULTISPECIES: Sec-independent protein translocase protein TatB [unclassified Sphingopyxis]|uniref:Sec-independent protein translocase protein TatB n=1 Tax=unclassified Sphingopyxis TaxID=2614943 RepID=UPI0007301C68|nr:MULTISPECIES: Sec-independent protein translocase protein TatB [unclassified Sphingopyxis]KTE23352.1 preprotein translocase subunit TatB [Sphingopyxis sp. H057]KTE52005.1 preprotein translocase subunit TatB [Sphingopyxis sp. H073]KTE52393.1 preprotein translocase subunit TatB [Sphingopyxis sp. H071]KTE59717.1 preprotein translocase subunit TatB [Sphingopyxis sp. H107]KTE64711.1 preprotein translocase subunit TatB [Sphingopyxis sp. H100]